MSKNYFVIVYCYMICCCELFCQIPCYANSTSWSAVNLLIDGRADNRTRLHTTESYGIIFKTTTSTNNINNKTTTTNVTNSAASPFGDLWTKIEVTAPPVQRSTLLRSKYHATLTNPLHITRSPPVTTVASSHVRSIIHQNEPNAQPQPQTTLQSTQVSAANTLTTSIPTASSSNRSSAEQLTSVSPTKGVNGETGHAFFDDDDDDDDDDYDDDDDDDEDYIQKKGDDDDDEDEEIVDDEKNVEDAADTVDADPQEEYENYAETRPPIILRTRRKNKRKRGKKHTSIKIKDFKKLRKFMLPLLLAYKLKFFTLVPLLLGGLVLIVATTGFAGFFFALFAVGLGLKHHH